MYLLINYYYSLILLNEKFSLFIYPVEKYQENLSVKCVPLKLHFYIAKLRYAGVYLFFLFLLQNIDCGYSLEPPRRGGSNVYPQSMF